MRKILCSICFCFVALVSQTGCESPIAGVSLGLNPDGTFGVGVQLKNGQLIQFDNVTPGQLVALQKKYRISERMITRHYATTRAVDACNYGRGFEPIAAVQTRELARCGGEARFVTRAVSAPIVEVVDVSPSLARRFRNFWTGRPIMSVKADSQCNCEAVAIPNDFNPPSGVPIPPTPYVPPQIPEPSNDGAPPSGIMKSPDAMTLIFALQQRADAQDKAIQRLTDSVNKLSDAIAAKK